MHLADGRTVDGDLVVLAGGRRGDVPAWFAAIGAAPVDEDDEDTGIVYWSRFYRLTGEAPVSEGPIGGDLGYLKFAVFQGDNGTFSVTLATPNEDAALRALSSPERFDAAAAAHAADRTVAGARRERSDHRGAPDGEAPQPHPTLRRRRSPGRPRSRRHRRRPHLHEPALRAGCSLGIVHAELLADAVAEHDAFDDAFHLAFEAATAREIEPWYNASVTQDRAQRAEAHRLLLESRGEAPEPAEGDATRRWCSASSCARSSAKACSRHSAPMPPCSARSSAASTCWRPPTRSMQDTEVMAKVLEAYQSRDEREPDPRWARTAPTLLELIGIEAA